jgi:aspartyl-tRNA(Asn)/glutamyl-tRNA(Gln) amidotransferase subunit A
MLGKTQMGPLAITRATTPNGEITTNNAWTPGDSRTDPGGSSTGSATAVAGRLATSSIGTQTGGSITDPSRAQGLTGLKPTHGRTSVYGVIPLSLSRDHSGTLSRDALDAAIMTRAMAGFDPKDPRTHGLPPVPDLVRAARPVRSGSQVRVRFPTRLGVPPGFSDGVSPGTAAAQQAMLATFQSLGVTVVDLKIPAEFDELANVLIPVAALPEAIEAHRRFLQADIRQFGVVTLSFIAGLFLSGDEYVSGRGSTLAFIRLVMDHLFDQCDAVLQTDPNPFDSIGLPLIEHPIGFETNEFGFTVPVGNMIGALPFGEERLLALVAAFQAVTDFHRRRPPEPVSTAAPRAPVAPRRLTAEEAFRQSARKFGIRLR